MSDFFSSQGLTNLLLIILVLVLAIRWREHFRPIFHFLHFFWIKNGRWWSWIFVGFCWVFAVNFFLDFIVSSQSDLALDDFYSEKYGEDYSGLLIGLGVPSLFVTPYMTVLRVKNILERWRSGIDF